MTEEEEGYRASFVLPPPPAAALLNVVCVVYLSTNVENDNERRSLNGINSLYCNSSSVTLGGVVSAVLLGFHTHRDTFAAAVELSRCDLHQKSKAT